MARIFDAGFSKICRKGAHREILNRLLYPKGSETLNSIKKKSLKALANGFTKFEDGRNAVKNSDFSDLKSFIKDYLNTSDSKQRKKLAEEFKKRHIELHDFLKDNQELISAETEIAKTVNAVLNGDTATTDDKQLTNLFEIIEGGLKK